MSSEKRVPKVRRVVWLEGLRDVVVINAEIDRGKVHVNLAMVARRIPLAVVTGASTGAGIASTHAEV